MLRVRVADDKVCCGCMLRMVRCVAGACCRKSNVLQSLRVSKHDSRKHVYTRFVQYIYIYIQTYIHTYIHIYINIAGEETVGKCVPKA